MKILYAVIGMLYWPAIIFFITLIHRVRFIFINGRASRVKPSENKFWKEVGKKFLEKKFGEKNVGKIYYKRKIFITKIYSNIDKCHTIFALLAPFDRTGRKTGSNENVCGIWFIIGSVARSHCRQVMCDLNEVGRKDIITACKLSVTRLPRERYLLHRWYENF